MIVNSIVAKHRGRSGLVWAPLGFFAPIISTVVLLILPKTNSVPTPQQQNSSASGDVVVQVEKLHGLLKSGAITQDEYDSQKKRLLKAG